MMAARAATWRRWRAAGYLCAAVLACVAGGERVASGAPAAAAAGPRADAVVPVSDALHVYYRLSERPANTVLLKRRPAWVNDAVCLRSALAAFAGDARLVVFVDGPIAPATREVLDAAVARGAASAVAMDGGSAAASFAAALDAALALRCDLRRVRRYAFPV